MAEPNKSILVLIHLLEVWNAVKPTIDQAIANEEARTGMTREQLHAFSKQLIAETESITAHDMSNEP